jgi:hypothetical protein
MARMCDRCGATQVRKMGSRLRFCAPCQVARFRDNGGTEAHKAVQTAIRRGHLPPAKDCICVDCGVQARDYDHRDYAKVLAVAPVCRSCNRKRGPARPVLTFELPDECTLTSAAPSPGSELAMTSTTTAPTNTNRRTHSVAA